MTITELPVTAVDLVDGRNSRWIPVRAGILNVWRYYDEVFEFHDGRLLLRGPNGSGKSKALELLLPFLFDASLRANRLSTFGTGERTMHWNMMGEGASGVTRVGYVWLEFGVRGAPGQWFTCGARLQASAHTSTVHPDYFTTDLHIASESGSTGTGFAALTAEGRPLTRAALEQLLGDHGTVYDNASDYRDAVRTTLFPAMTEQRYDALIMALLQLRTPKLSQRLDPALLSTLLSKALPPLDQDEIADLAEGFERLDAQRERLARAEAEVQATKALARQQRAYAQRVLRSSAAALLTTTSELDKLSATAKQSAEAFARAESDIAAAAVCLESLRREYRDAEARRDGLLESDAYKQGRELDTLRGNTVLAERRAEESRALADRSLADAALDTQRHREAVEAADAQQRAVTECASDAEQAAVRAGMPGVFAELADTVESAHVRALLRGAVKGRRSQIDEVERVLGRHEQAVEARGRAERDLDAARTVYATAADSRSTAHAARDNALEELRNRLEHWASRCTVLRLEDLDQLTARAPSEPAVLELVNAAAAVLRDEITRSETRCESEIGAVRAERAELVADRERLRGEEDIPPTPPPWRTADRSVMTGAPLWRLVDFLSGVPDSTRAGVEAALEASGLLDAWIGADGSVTGHDVFASPSALPPVAGRSLTEVLVPVPVAPVAPEPVHRLLSAIAFGDGLPEGAVAADGLPESVAVVAADGHWRMGSLSGSWIKPQPMFVGALTRQRVRERRIGELDAAITALDGTLATFAQRLRGLADRRATVATEIAARPTHDAVLAAQSALTEAESDLRAADGVVRDRIADVATCEQAVRSALLALTALAAQSGLPADSTALQRISAALDAFENAAETWLDACRDWRGLTDVTAERADRLERSTELSDQRQAQAISAEDEHRALAAKLTEIEATVGLDYRQVLTRLSEVRDRLAELDTQRSAEQRSLTELSGLRGELKSRHETDIQSRDATAISRDQLTHRFRHLAAGTLAPDSEIPDLAAFRATLAGSEGVRAARDAARLVAAAWPSIPHAEHNIGDALNRLAAAVHECRTALAARADLDLETDGGAQILTAVIDGVRIGAAELLRILRTEADQAQQEITDGEHRLFDRTLTGDTRRHLAARIRQANDLVDAMNSRLTQVRTASDVSVRLVGEIASDLPPGTRAARELLLKDPIRLTDADRESLHRFLRDRIEAAKADDTATTWEQQLSQVFDYTSWHRFVVKVDRGKGNGWQLLTKKLHGALSGGEKAIALHLPLFAAVAAHYQSVPTAARLILLDEVFVGVDTTNRGQIFALLSALDLDLVLTSDHEWCTYAELSGIGIHQILTGDGDDAVTTARFVWDGAELRTGD
ncbi:TIGR02680 family protein [Nocardia seriolae]|uniref:TIGR02680 family protein n=1 Tax=Nocardia seriolae TaxID=37332 RepID=UPI00090CD60A|nr:TIGR02680 family protein [Nocardia seriolae]BAW05542.1 conserved hypothetical protein [Nocardia seriolae]